MSVTADHSDSSPDPRTAREALENFARQSELLDQEVARQFAEMDQVRTELLVRAEQLRRERERLDQREAELAARDAELAARDADHQQQVRSWREREARLEATVERLESFHTAQAQQLEQREQQLRAEFAAASDAHAHQRPADDEIAREADRLRQQCRSLENELERVRRQAAELHETVEDQKRELAELRHQAIEDLRAVRQWTERQATEPAATERLAMEPAGWREPPRDVPRMVAAPSGVSEGSTRRESPVDGGGSNADPAPQPPLPVAACGDAGADPVMRTVMAQFARLQHDAAARRRVQR